MAFSDWMPIQALLAGLRLVRPEKHGTRRSFPSQGRMAWVVSVARWEYANTAAATQSLSTAPELFNNGGVTSLNFGRRSVVVEWTVTTD
jgi:hypothetical protein